MPYYLVMLKETRLGSYLWCAGAEARVTKRCSGVALMINDEQFAESVRACESPREINESREVTMTTHPGPTMVTKRRH